MNVSRSAVRATRSALRRTIAWSRRRFDPWLALRRPGTAALLHVGRSGSTLLGSMLGQHRRVFWNGEVLAQAIRSRGGGRKEGDAQEILARNSRSAGTRYHLVSLKFYHLEAFGITTRDYAEFLHTSSISHPIVLRRENLLRKLISSVIASHSGRYHRRAGEAEPTPTLIEVDPQLVAIDGRPISLLEHLDAWRHEFEAIEEALAGRPHLKLSFETDIQADPRCAYQRACTFLEIPAGQPEVVFRPTNPFPLHELIANFDQVADQLAGTQYEWMLTH